MHPAGKGDGKRVGGQDDGVVVTPAARGSRPGVKTAAAITSSRGGLRWWKVMEHLPWPTYLGLGAGEVRARAEAARRLLGPSQCGVCPRLCKVNRLADQRGLCAVGLQAVIASACPAFR